MLAAGSLGGCRVLCRGGRPLSSANAPRVVWRIVGALVAIVFMIVAIRVTCAHYTGYFDQLLESTEPNQ
jgi:arginine exporter protein ArgO